MESRYIDYDLYQMVKKLTDHNDLCNICKADETKHGKKWKRYMLSCGHMYHAKCLRKWCFSKMCISCPSCGYIKPIYKNKYCSVCDIFDHPTISCNHKSVEGHTITQVQKPCVENIFFEEYLC